MILYMVLTNNSPLKIYICGASQAAPVVKNPPTDADDTRHAVRSLGREYLYIYPPYDPRIPLLGIYSKE